MPPEPTWGTTALIAALTFATVLGLGNLMLWVTG